VKISPRNEGTPSPRPPLANIQQPGRPLTPALESLEESSDEEGTPKEPKPGTRHAHFTRKTLSDGSLPLTVQGQPAQATIEEEEA